MVKSFISMLCVAAVLTLGGIAENLFIKKEFGDFRNIACELHLKIEDETAEKEDAVALQDNWLNRKKYLHAFIPHTEIKEMDLWLSETVSLIEDKKWEESKSKVKVIINLSEQIPQTFMISWENIL